jgi:hypothetical protein
MTANKTLRLLKKMGDLMRQLANIKETLGKSEFFEDLSEWGVVGIYYNCKIKNGKLYTDKDELLSDNGICMDEEIPYFVNQYTGYCGDDFYGTMFIRVGDLNTFVAVAYEC